MTTENHEWDKIEPGDPNYDDAFDELIDDIDEEVQIYTTGEPEDQATWAIDLETATAYYHDGFTWNELVPVSEPDLPTVIQEHGDYRILARWESEVTINADIDGRARKVDFAETSEMTNDVPEIDGRTADDFVLTDTETNVIGRWTFKSRPKIDTLTFGNTGFKLGRYG